MTNIHEAKTQLSRLVERAAAGEEIVIAKAGKPMAKLVPYHAVKMPRKGGFLAGQVWEAAGAWEAETDFGDGSLFPEPARVPRVAEDAASYRTSPDDSP